MTNEELISKLSYLKAELVDDCELEAAELVAEAIAKIIEFDAMQAEK